MGAALAARSSLRIVFSPDRRCLWLPLSRATFGPPDHSFDTPSPLLPHGIPESRNLKPWTAGSRHSLDSTLKTHSFIYSISKASRIVNNSGTVNAPSIQRI